jgi:DNA mismatch repair ATPase MutS
MLQIIAALPTNVDFFTKLHARMGSTLREPLVRIDSLVRLVRFANLKRDGLFGIPYYVSQIFLLTDFHVVALMDLWKRRYGSLVRRWLEAVGQFEAISSLATLAHDHPHWAFPKIEPAENIIAAVQLGHPLLDDARCVSNDITVGPPGSFVLVTGSNMSGKSTLLRAVGVNVTLAQAGGPVCARQLCLPPIDLATCMRIRDSLADGVSFFLAELRRLKEIVDQAPARPAVPTRTMLYLLDEILQGTNSVERHIAVVRVVGRLVSDGSIGMVSTHDLELANSRQLSEACRVVHFRESFTERDGREQMTFDYQLRPGLAPTTNALKLLAFVGLGD